MKPKILAIPAIIIVLLFCLPLVSALGVRPANTNLASEETNFYQGKIWVVNNDRAAFSAKIYAEGEMGQFVTLKNAELTFREDDDALPVEFEIALPQEVPAGTSTASIVIEQVLESQEENVISSKVVLKHKINIQGPYPEKFVKTKLNFREEGDKVMMVSEVENLGKKDLQEVSTTFYVNNKEQVPIQKETPTTELKTKENKLLTAEVEKKQFGRGEFIVSAVTKYDDQKVEMTKKMILGKPEIDITYFDRYFIANKINKYSLDLLNKWNQPIENVYVDIEVKKKDQKIDEFRTPSVDLAALITKRINDHFDARDKNPGRYTFEMIVNFWNTYKMDKKIFQSEILTDEEFEELAGNSPAPALSGQAVAGSAEKETQTGSWGTVALWIIIGMFFGAASFYVLWRYIHRDEYE